jgi:uncharacterized phage-associated protein
MTVSAHDIAAELRKRLPGLPKKKLHTLLYYCQAHHLATFDSPMFRETVSAWDMGPVVGTLWWEENEAGGPVGGDPYRLDEAALNTIGYVVSRYGSLTGMDLEHLTHTESPWVEADRRQEPHDRARISHESMRDYFRYSDSDDDETGTPSVDAEVLGWLADAEQWQAHPRVPDSLDRLRARATSA